MNKQQRQVVLDTETTGMSPSDGHRIIEIGCVELVNKRLTGNTFHEYINPERVIDAGAIRVHGISNEFLYDKPKFEQIADAYLRFTQGAELIIHNAPFDVGFLNHELSLLNKKKTTVEAHSTVFDTLVFARKKRPGARVGLTALCKYYGIDDSDREFHGALLDAQLLADVYLAMTRKQFAVFDSNDSAQSQQQQKPAQLATDRPKLKVIKCSEQELEAHQSYLALVAKTSGECLWHKLDEH